MSHNAGTNTKRTLIFLGAVMAATAILTVPVGHAASLAPKFARFLGCPSPTEDPSVKRCLRAVVRKGNISIGDKIFSVTTPMVLTGGIDIGFKNFAFNLKGGIAPIRQRIPGGLIDLTGFDWLGDYLDPNDLKLYEVTELAGTPIIGFAGSTLPLKIHLISAALSNNCRLGSQSAPIVLNLTTGTTEPPPPNKPISGIEPTFMLDELSEVLTLQDGQYVDNSFAAPGASGCMLKLPGISPVNINGLVGLPSPGGHNEAVGYLDTEVVESATAYPYP